MQWKCIFRASEHNFNASSYHAKCDPHVNKLVIVQSENGNIFGGFISINSTHSNSQQRNYHSSNQSISVTDSRAFLFTLVNQENIPPQKFPPINPGQGSELYHQPSYGPCWGSSQDLWISNGPQSTSHSTFGGVFKNPRSKPYLLGGQQSFKVTEYEVWIPS